MVRGALSSNNQSSENAGRYELTELPSKSALREIPLNGNTSGQAAISEHAEPGEIIPEAQMDTDFTKIKRMGDLRTVQTKVRNFKIKHEVQPVPASCLAGLCRLKCRQSISHEARKEINGAVNNLQPSARREWYRRYVHLLPQPSSKKPGKHSKRFMKWYLPAGSDTVTD